jgi:hypothetical protein
MLGRPGAVFFDHSHDGDGRCRIFLSLADRDDAGEHASNLIEKFYAYPCGHIPDSV